MCEYSPDTGYYPAMEVLHINCNVDTWDLSDMHACSPRALGICISRKIQKYYAHFICMVIINIILNLTILPLVMLTVAYSE